MRVPYLIDGNNLCGAARDRRLGLPVDEQELIRHLGRFADRRAAFLTVVFDGPAESRRGAGTARGAGRVRVIYSGAGRSADDRILDLIHGFASPKDITLVSSDRALRSRARALGSRVMGCGEFAGIIRRISTGRRADSDAEEKPLPGDVEEWERYFTTRGRGEPSS